MRVALSDAAPLYRDAPEAQEARASGDRIVQSVHAGGAARGVGSRRGRWPAELIAATLSAVGKQFSETPRTAREIEAYADAMADMFCAYLEELDRA